MKVNFKDISSTAQILAVLGQSKPGDWDVVVMDQTDTGRLAKMGVLAPLEAKDYPFADIPAQIADPKLSSLDGVLYTVPEKFGYNTVAFDKIRRAGIGHGGYPGALGPEIQGPGRGL